MAELNASTLLMQANMTVQQVLDFWPKMMETGLRLGSPATSEGAEVTGQWLGDFMAQV